MTVLGDQNRGVVKDGSFPMIDHRRARLARLYPDIMSIGNLSANNVHLSEQAGSQFEQRGKRRSCFHPAIRDMSHIVHRTVNLISGPSMPVRFQEAFLIA